MTPKLSPSLDIHALVQFSPTLFLGWLCDQQNMAEVLLCHFQGSDTESTVASSLLSPLDRSLLGKRVAMLGRDSRSSTEGFAQ